MNIKLLVASAVGSAIFALQAVANDAFIAHEWGTFTAVQSADGAQLVWTPTLKTDLPEFVYSRDTDNGGIRDVSLLFDSGKGQTASIVRMETPVIYFYSKAQRDVDVEVEFPNGLITEWYPQATSVGPYTPTSSSPDRAASRSMIGWRNVRVLPRDTQDISVDRLIRGRDDPRASHYYTARLTDANFLRVSEEHERDLFYRGVGFFNAPMTVTMNSGDTAVTISTRNVQPLTAVFVLSIRQTDMRYEKADHVAPGESVTIELGATPFTPLDETRARLMQDMAGALVQHGLYAKEARAMVDTWADQWFAEEGTRVLYLLPREWTDATLPLNIRPRPDGIVRVMVGRAEMITPSKERDLKKQIVAYRSGDAASKLAAVDSVRKLALGRFLSPAIQKALGPSEDDALIRAAYELASLASQSQPPDAVARSEGSAAGR